MSQGCALCTEPGGHLVWEGAWLRVVRPDDALYPGYYRIVWRAHRAEFTDLDALQRAACMDALALVEEALRARLSPDKVNLASLGNMVPHLHWHVIARWHGDAHWPNPVWGAQQRPPDTARVLWQREQLEALDADVAARLRKRFGAAG